MKKNLKIQWYLAVAQAINLTSCNMSSEKEAVLSAPIAKKIPVVYNTHGIERIDDYHWLRDRENQEVIDYLNRENAYAEAGMASVADLKDRLFDEIKGRIAQTDMSVPYTYNGYSYYTRYVEGGEHPIHCRKAVGSEEEEVLLDANELAKPFAYFDIGSREISHDNNLLAYGEDTLSRRIYTIRFKDLKTGTNLSDVLEGTTGSAVWAKDNKTVFYTVKDLQTLRSYRVYKHVLGTPQGNDELIYEETDDTFYTSAYLSKSKDYIIIGSGSTLTTEFRFLPSDDPSGVFKVFHPRERGLEYSISHFGNEFYILHNGDGAENFKLSKATIGKTEKEYWEDVIDHRSDVFLEGIEIFKDFLVVEERSNGLTKIRVMPWDKTVEEHYISFTDPAYTAYISTNPEYETDLLRYGYTSLVTPNSVYDYNMKSRSSDLLKQQEIVGGYEMDNYVSERVFATGRDGTEIPISIVYRKGFERNGKSPLLLYAYGSYGASMDAYFSSTRLSLLDRGFVFAIAHIRGGQEMGRQWYENGKLLKKKNTFYDFIDCGEFLVNEGYTSPDHLYAMGGSAGGLLMGAIANLKPELWNGIVAQVPFVDVINTMLDASIPLTTGEYDEWGNPNDKEYFEYILSYSPYDNVDSLNYPAMLITTGLHDSQVQYWEPAKWVAKLRMYNKGTKDLFLVTNMDAGHGGASGRFERYKEVALEYAFLLKQEGISQ